VTAAIHQEDHMGNEGATAALEEFGNGLRARLDSWHAIRGGSVSLEPVGALQLLVDREPEPQELSLRQELMVRATAATAH
jgi:hypothetical protein